MATASKAPHTNGTAEGVAGRVVVHADDSLPVRRTKAPIAVPQRRGAAEYDVLLGRLLRQFGVNASSNFAGFASPQRKSGVSTIAANLAIRAADHQVGPVLLVDANTIRPQQHRAFRLNRGPGLREILSGDATLDDTVQATRIVDLSLLPLGKKTGALVTPAVTGEFESLSQELRERFSLVVFDLPSSEALINWVPLARELDALVMVLACASSSRSAAIEMQRKLSLDGVAFTGTVLNRYKKYTPNWLSGDK